MATLEPLAGYGAGLPVGSQTVLAGGATYTSPDFQMAPRFKRISGSVYASHTGTLNIQIRTTSGTYVTLQPIPVGAGVPVVFDYLLCVGAARITYVNGATLQTEFDLQVFGGV